MTLPTYENCLRPILEMSATADISRRTVLEPVSDLFELTPEERSKTIPSGHSTVMQSRTGWAMTFLTKGGLIEKVSRGQYRITERGREFLIKYPQQITHKDLRAIPGWEQAWGMDKKAPRNAGEHEADSSESTASPIELVESGIQSLRSELAVDVLKNILAQSPTFFEHLVLDVLLAMGYGGSRESAAAHLGKAGDEGIDGRVNQDALGLDQIMVQAKRYAPDRPIDRQTVQAFIGSLAGQGVTKGILITTSYFNENALEFVRRGSNTKVVLVDGEQLVELMLRYHIGVRVSRTVEILELDQNYFEDD
jgi:restriction system protein